MLRAAGRRGHPGACDPPGAALRLPGYDSATLDRPYSAAATEALNTPFAEPSTSAQASTRPAAAAAPSAAACKKAVARQAKRNFDISMSAQDFDDPWIDRSEPAACRGLDQAAKNRIAREVADELAAAPLRTG